jgi:hypothetical protein
MNKRRLIVFSLLALLILAMVTTVAAKEPSASAILWRVFGGGGAPVSGGDVTLNGSLGQTAIGSAAAGKAQIGSGYWYAMQPYAVMLPMIVR